MIKILKVVVHHFPCNILTETYFTTPFRRQSFLGDKMSGETAHRDVAKFKLPEDEIFGGWLNLDIGRGLVGWLVEQPVGWMDAGDLRRLIGF